MDEQVKDIGTSTADIPAATTEAKPVAPSLDELKAQLAKAIADGNDPLFNELVVKIAKRKSEAAKIEAEKLKAEAEKLAGVRLTLSGSLHKAVLALNLDKQLSDVKALGFTYHLDTPDANGVITKAHVALLVPTVKTARGGTTGGGKSKDEYGMSLGEIFDKFATAEDKTNLAAAGDSNSKQWQVKVAVKKRAIAESKLTPIK